jgi:hypothetical protein
MIFDIASISTANKYVVVCIPSDRCAKKGVCLIKIYVKDGWVLDPTLLAVRRLDVYGPPHRNYKKEDQIISVIFGKTSGDAY